MFPNLAEDELVFVHVPASLKFPYTMRFPRILIADHEFCSAEPDCIYFIVRGHLAFEMGLDVEIIEDGLKLDVHLIASSIP